MSGIKKIVLRSCFLCHWQIIFAIGCFLTMPITQGASFDCSKVRVDVEKMICADAVLSKLDEELNEAYKAALKDENQDKVIHESQKQWLKYRNNCKDADCVKRAYEMRLSSLTVTHVYAFSWGETDEEQKAAVYTSGSIDMRKPGYPFKLYEGKGVEVCEIYKKNLEALGNSNLACERKISPKYKDLIKFPQWRKLDLWENRNLWAQVEKMANGVVNMPGRMESKDAAIDKQREIDFLAKRYQEHVEQSHEEVYKLYLADMDVDNDGSKEPVLREHSGLCGEPVHYKSIALFVLDEKGDSVDLQKSRSLFQDPWYSPWTKKVEPNGTFSNGSMYDIFFYKDKTYFDLWTSSGIWVYQISNKIVEAVCHLK